ncbi:hypothetical protein FD725_02835 [Nostoc sp. TCL26-01]|nr:hypothetical protein FD725_02835 [Nostoc sp. TCL26-01]
MLIKVLIIVTKIYITQDNISENTPGGDLYLTTPRVGIGDWGQGDKGTRGQGDKGTRGQGDKERITLAYSLLPITCYLLPVTCYLLPITYYPLPITY